MKTNKGFTLIELLIVISIIALLSSITVTSLSAARKKAEIAADVQNIKALINANELYKVKTGKYIFEDYWASYNVIYAPDGYTTVTANNYEGNTDFDDTMQPLVTEGLIPSIPTFHNWPNNIGTYITYFYAPKNNIFTPTEEGLVNVTEEFYCEGVNEPKYLFVVLTNQDVSGMPHFSTKVYTAGVLDDDASEIYLNSYCYGA